MMLSPNNGLNQQDRSGPDTQEELFVQVDASEVSLSCVSPAFMWILVSPQHTVYTLYFKNDTETIKYMYWTKRA